MDFHFPQQEQIEDLTSMLREERDGIVSYLVSRIQR
jgi:hypothetical protein